MAGWEDAGFGAGGGIMGAVLVWLGFKSRMDKVEKDLSVHITEAAGTYVGVKECSMCRVNTSNQLQTMDKKLDQLLERKEKERG